MKNKPGKYLLAPVALAVALMAAGCASINILDTDYQSFTVVLEPNEPTPGTWVLEVKSEPQGWEAGVGDPVKKRGYVGFARGKFGSVTLSLNQLPLNRKCTGVPATSADWVITRIALSKSGSPVTQKGNNFGNNQGGGWLKSAFPQADDDGIVLDVPKNEGVVSFTVGNRNNHKGRQWAYYQVTATRCSDGVTAVTDPGWQNGGHN